MRILKMAAPAALAILLAGCDDVVSLYPLYDDRTLVFEPALLGSWTEGDSGERWTFEQAGEKTYRLTVTDSKETTEITAHLVELGGLLFLDLAEEEAGATGIQGHMFGLVRVERDSLRLGFLKSGWLAKKLKQEQALPFLAAPKGEGRMVMVAPTRELQYFILRHALDPEAFDSSELVRVQ